MNRLAGFGRIAAALRNPNYGIYTLGSGLSLIGTWMQRVATGWLTWELTKSGTWLGLVAFADLFPTVVIGPFAGAVADRWNRLTLTKISQAIAMLQALALFGLTVTGLIDRWLLLGLVVVLGSAAAFNQPARLALIHSLVPREHLGAAVAINSVVFNLARFVGPAIAGLVIVAAGVSAAFALNALSFVFFLIALSRIRIAASDDSASRVRQTLAEALLDGVRYVRNHGGIAPLLVLLIVMSIGARPLIELLPGFSARIFQAGAEGLAIMTASIGIGAVVGGIWLAGRADPRGLTAIVLVSTLSLGVSTFLFALTETLWFAVPLLVLSGGFIVCAGIGTQTLIQLSVEGSVRGRVLSLYGLIFRGGPALGALAMGVASDMVGLRWPVMIGAALVLVAWLWTARRRRRMTAALEADL